MFKDANVVEVKAPGYYGLETSVFLAGSIEMGAAEMWQEKAFKYLKNKIKPSMGCTVLNPRRDDWDSSWEQDINNPQFYEQVTWEKDGIKAANVVFFYFDPNTKSPITLMELGYVLGKFPNKAVVCCPEGFWRKGNVDVMCSEHGVTVFTGFESALFEVTRRLC